MEMKPSFRIRFTAKKGQYLYVMAETPPHKRMMFSGDKSSWVSLPWMVFVVVLHSYVPRSGGFSYSYSGLFTYFRDAPLESATDELELVPFSNTVSTGFVCLGHPPSLENISYETVEDAVAAVIPVYYSTEFSSDHGFQRSVLDCHYPRLPFWAHVLMKGDWFAFEPKDGKINTEEDHA
jgi:hypothetical protein